ncbi:MAG TPA: radical SAM protein [Bacillota bacterium]|nr:radical SAM protein [Bacillota bacterium]
MIKQILAKTLLGTVKDPPDRLFGLRYNLNLYRGCGHGCIYCDSRSLCYRIENFDDILIKENALELLEKELRSKRKKGTIGTGSMNDPYMPVEAETQLARRTLAVMARFGFPVHILTKSDLVTRDIDLIKQISRAYAAVSFTITTADDELAGLIEPSAPAPSRRFEALQTIAGEGLYTGILLMPVLPYLTDSQKNLETIIQKGRDAGAQYILFWPGMTLREGQREYYYKELDRKFPGLKEKYMKRYGDSYQCSAPESQRLSEVFNEGCEKAGISTKMKFYEEPEEQQLSLF